MSSERIPNAKIIPLPDLESNAKKWKGKSIFSKRHWVWAMLGKRRSGKTTKIANILRLFCSKKQGTRVIFFCSTFNNDPNYDLIRQWLDDNEIPYTYFTENDGNVSVLTKMIEEEGERREQALQEYKEKLEAWKEKQKEKNKPTSIASSKKVLIDGKSNLQFDIDEKEEKPKKPIFPKIEHLVVLDDMGTLRDPNISKLVKNSRNYKCKVFLSSQSDTDIHPHMYENLDALIIPRGHNLKSLEHMHNLIKPRLEFDQFVRLYNHITHNDEELHEADPKRYEFLFVDRVKDKFRRNLDEVLKI